MLDIIYKISFQGGLETSLGLSPRGGSALDQGQYIEFHFDYLWKRVSIVALTLNDCSQGKAGHSWGDAQWRGGRGGGEQRCGERPTCWCWYADFLIGATKVMEDVWAPIQLPVKYPRGFARASRPSIWHLSLSFCRIGVQHLRLSGSGELTWHSGVFKLPTVICPSLYTLKYSRKAANKKNRLS